MSAKSAGYGLIRYAALASAFRGVRISGPEVPCANVCVVRFEWDPGKAALNLVTHGVSFEEASSVFGNPLAVTFFDPDHSDEEDRYLTFGESQENRQLAVVHTDREGTVRVISAREMTRKERQQYEQGDW